MNAVQLHDREGDCIGTVFSTKGTDYGVITDAWDLYIIGKDDFDLNIEDFIEEYSMLHLKEIQIDIYQPVIVEL